MTKAIYKKTLKDGANIVALDQEVTFYHFQSFLTTGTDTGCSCWGHCSEDEGKVVGIEAGQSICESSQVDLDFAQVDKDQLRQLPDPEGPPHHPQVGCTS